MAEFKNDRKYSKSHEWILVEGDVATLGISDFAQSELGDLVYCEAEETGSELETGDIFGSIESVKAASDLYMPVSGEIIETNEELEDSPENMNSDPYGSWIVKIKLSDPSELDELLDADAYKAMCEEA
ncbi:MAG: glycine cleavage system protein GcvH [Eubacteriales bacterium]|nr:glycine cleavage system protein GcvH [Eubacteriales bacterium]